MYGPSYNTKLQITKVVQQPKYNVVYKKQTSRIFKACLESKWSIKER